MKCIDVHCYYGKWPFPIRDMSIPDMLETMEALDIEKSILMSSRAILYDFIAGNRELAEIIKPHPNLYGYVYINLNYPEASCAQIDDYLASDRFVGVKYHGGYSGAPICAPQNRPIFERIAEEYDKPVLVHTWGVPEHGNSLAHSLPSQVLELAQELPNLQLVMGHMGGPDWTSAIAAAKAAPNLYLDTCASYADSDKVATAVSALGADRILFGSSMTENNPYMQKAVVLDAQISVASKEKILYSNARRIFGI